MLIYVRWSSHYQSVSGRIENILSAHDNLGVTLWMLLASIDLPQGYDRDEWMVDVRTQKLPGAWHRIPNYSARSVSPAV
jgi:hypothetical protein